MSALPLFDASLKPHYTDYIYALRHPESFDIFYVGKTQNPQSRLLSHIYDSTSDRGAGQRKKAIIKSIVGLDKKPIMSIIDKTDIRITIDKHNSSYKEIRWMQFYKDIGWDLSNFNAINKDISSTDYMQYKKLIRMGEIPSIDYYYYALGKDGKPIYDLFRLKADGYVLNEEKKKEPAEEVWLPKKPTYNPWDNPRFVKMLDLDKKEDEYWYRDTDPNYYDDDY